MAALQADLADIEAAMANRALQRGPGGGRGTDEIDHKLDVLSHQQRGYIHLTAAIDARVDPDSDENGNSGLRAVLAEVPRFQWRPAAAAAVAPASARRSPLTIRGPSSPAQVGLSPLAAGGP